MSILDPVPERNLSLTVLEPDDYTYWSQMGVFTTKLMEMGMYYRWLAGQSPGWRPYNRCDGGETGSTEVVKHWLHTESVTFS